MTSSMFQVISALDDAFERYWAILVNEQEALLRAGEGNPEGLQKYRDTYETAFQAGWHAAISNGANPSQQSIPGVAAQRVAKAAREACAPMVRYDKGSLEDMQQQAIEAMRAELLKIAEWLESVADKD